MFPFRFIPPGAIYWLRPARSADEGQAWRELPPALATPPGSGAVADAAGARKIGRGAAEGYFTTGPVLVAHASLTARRLGLAAPARNKNILDLLELFAFVQPAVFCAPSPTGLALALGRPEPTTVEDQAALLRAAAAQLLDRLAEAAYRDREAAYGLALTLERA
ncbi:hypothetical protein LTR94_026316, partial [Friedmanniomyces endolithicus]